MFEIVDQIESNAVIKVIGVGGGGGNAVNHMLKHAVDGVEFIVANTDAQAMKVIPADRTIQLGGDITKGLGAGANPDVGRNAALEDREHAQWIVAKGSVVGVGGSATNDAVV